MIPAIGAAGLRVDTSQAVASTGPGLAAGASTSIASGQADFSTVMAQIAGDAMTTVKSAEATSMKGINGQATTQAVVESVMAAERTLQTAVSLRDKAVSAYMELTRMGM